jgi:FAD/FMN-containing dehydrogenase
MGLATRFRGFEGELFLPGETGYEQARRIHNGLIDKRPAVIARCYGVEDIVRSVEGAQDAGMALSIKGGGHGVAGRAIVEGGVVIDLSGMRSIAVDTDRRLATAGPGVIWGELDSVTQRHGLATTGGTVSTTGIAGLTLGGGFGWLMSKYGCAADNLLAATVVTADGQVLRASDTDHTDLYWAIRGGGAGLGVVASFDYRLHSVGPSIVGGSALYPIERAVDVLRFFRDFTLDLPDELTVYAALLHTPDSTSRQVAGIIVCHCGSEEQAARNLQDLEKTGPTVNAIRRQSYLELNSMLDASFPSGMLNYWKSGFLTEISDDAIEALVAQFRACPSVMTSLVIEHFHGAVTRVPTEATAMAHRKAGYSVLITSQWEESAKTNDNVAWTRETYQAVEMLANGRRYVNYLGEADIAESSGERLYGENATRLEDIRQEYDRRGIFSKRMRLSRRAENGPRQDAMAVGNQDTLGERPDGRPE